VQKLSLAFDLVAMTNEPLDLGMSNLVWRLTINMPTRYIRNVSDRSVINMAKKRNFRVISDKFNAYITCTYAISSSKKYNNSARSASIRDGLEICALRK
jgi:hypothetical protein